MTAGRSSPPGHFAHITTDYLARLKAASASKPAAAAGAKGGERTSSATLAGQKKPKPVSRFAHLKPMPGQALFHPAAQDSDAGSIAFSRASVRSFPTYAAAAAFILATVPKAGTADVAKPSGNTAEDMAAFVLASAAKPRGNRNGA